MTAGRFFSASGWPRKESLADVGATALAEHLAVASLQADVLATDDPVLVTAAVRIIPVAPVGDLLA